MNELMLKDFSVEYQAPKITVENEQDLAQAIELYSKKYNGLVVTDETLPDAKKARADLNKLSKAINDRRKEIKKGYNQPLKEFETKIKQWDSNLHDAMAGIDDGIHEMEELQTAERTKKVEQTITEMAPNYGVEPGEIEMKSRWATKSISHKKLLDEIAGEMNFVKRRHEQLAMVQKYCEDKGLSFEPYKRLAETFDPLEVMKQIDADVEYEEHRKEAQKAAKQAEIEKQKENTVEVNGKAFDKETGETVREEQKVSFTLQGSKEQIDGLARYIMAMGIQILDNSERETVIVKG
ncbi:hypothetical protein LFYK43_16750 [Ligilactobacillus salitolerans]|uniref:DUF1351 domain-containing protein n=1 Tax=Ligilactobacillus salitolerans TaxID=1808352 RepID=A0A401IUM5_9LACO|nr:DUF1351 domain-containing protein [Ligilactobacillus salitolerans]GBG95216.1 hypothetical protein LFYK43_16750 [Ligilactobacillus salitolerans]